MPWLSTLDARARQWPRPVFWGYLAVKWYLVIAGGIGLLYAWYLKSADMRGWF